MRHTNPVNKPIRLGWDDDADFPCPWSVLFGRRVRQAFSGINVTIDNKAMGGCGTGCAQPEVALHYSSYAEPAPDVVFFDFSQNNPLANADHYELLIRMVHFFSPS